MRVKVFGREISILVLVSIALSVILPSVNAEISETEPNDKADDSKVITITDYSETYKGKINVLTDGEDWWKIPLEAQDRITVELDDSGTGCQLGIKLIDTDNTTVLDKSAGAGVSKEIVTWDTTTKGDYYILIYSKYGTYEYYSFTVNVEDIGAPTFGTDSSPKTGTTGDKFEFKTVVTDNHAVDEVCVEYWYGDTRSHINDTMSGIGTYTKTITIPQNSLDTLHYIFSAKDTIGLWATSSKQNVTISDNDIPVFGTDTTPTGGTTGDNFTFSIAITDNIEVDSVNVEYGFGAGTQTTQPMKGTGTYTKTITIPSNSLDALYYKFIAKDTSDNPAISSKETVTISDNDNPTFGTDNTPTSATTGDPFGFSIVVNDNIDVKTVKVEYWYGTESHLTADLEGEGTYTKEITIRSDTTNSLYYKLTATDTSDNSGSTTEKTVTIMDNDNPQFGDDKTTATASTGDGFTFSIAISDNIAISEVCVEYWYGEEDHINVSMEGIEIYTKTITIEDTLDKFHYFFVAKDSANNWVKKSAVELQVEDNDKPTFGKDSTLTTATAGCEITFSIRVEDNIGVGGVSVKYWFGSEEPTSKAMSGEDNLYTLTITLLPATGTLNYQFVAKDTSDNSGTSNTSQITVTSIDTDSDGTPDAEDDDDDNDGYTDIQEKKEGTDPLDKNSYPKDKPKTDNDKDGIPDSEDTDDDNDGMLDDWERLYGLNPLVNDASEDLDSDGYTNLEEYKGKSNPTVKTSCPIEAEAYNMNIIIGVVIVVVIIIVIAVLFIFKRKKKPKSQTLIYQQQPAPPLPPRQQALPQQPQEVGGEVGDLFERD